MCQSASSYCLLTHAKPTSPFCLAALHSSRFRQSPRRTWIATCSQLSPHLYKKLSTSPVMCARGWSARHAAPQSMRVASWKVGFLLLPVDKMSRAASVKSRTGSWKLKLPLFCGMTERLLNARKWLASVCTWIKGMPLSSLWSVSR
jgi:hypothetical protein